MGLDMYLNARRACDEETATVVLRHLGMTREQIAAEDGGEFYLSMWPHSREGERETAQAVVKAAGLAALVTDDSPSGDVRVIDRKVTVAVHGMYWRKANAIHSWFVENCQGGVDECQESAVIDYEQLAHLAHVCREAVAAYNSGDLVKAGEILMPVGGFFFGSTEVDEYWLGNAVETAEGLEVLVGKAIAVGGVTFTYQSSW